MKNLLFTYMMTIFLLKEALGLVGGSVSLPLDSVLIWSSATYNLKESYCSGTKISEKHILTAAHCVLLQRPSSRSSISYVGPWERDQDLAPGKFLQYSFIKDTKNKLTTDLFKIKKIHLADEVLRCLKTQNHKDPVCKNRVPLPDIAIIEIEPKKNGSFLLRDNAKIDKSRVGKGRHVIVAGYGNEGKKEMRSPRLKFAHVLISTSTALKKALESTYATINGFPDMHYFFSHVSTPGTKGHVNLGSGDSGGPVFNSYNGKIVGVNSDGYCDLDNKDCELANNSIFARIDNDVLGDWFEKVLKGRGK